MKRMLSFVLAGIYGTLVCLGLYGAITLTGSGCDAVQHVANDVHDVTLGPPAAPAHDPSSTQPSSTQPSTHDQVIQAAHAGVQGAEIVAPQITPIVSLIGGIAGLIGLVAGGMATKKKYGGVVSEIADDIASFKDPNTPWTTKTFNVLVGLGKLSAAVTDGGPVSVESVGGAKA